MSKDYQEWTTKCLDNYLKLQEKIITKYDEITSDIANYKGIHKKDYEIGVLLSALTDIYAMALTHMEILKEGNK